MSNFNIELLLPHRAPMLMISDVIARGEEDIHCQVRIDELNNPFISNGMLPGFVCLEFVAQSCGIFLGLNARESDSEPPGSGAIVSVRDMRIDSKELVAEMLLDVKAHFLGGNQQAAMFSGEVFLGENKLFETKVTVATFEKGNV